MVSLYGFWFCEFRYIHMVYFGEVRYIHMVYLHTICKGMLRRKCIDPFGRVDPNDSQEKRSSHFGTDIRLSKGMSKWPRRIRDKPQQPYLDSASQRPRIERYNASSGYIEGLNCGNPFISSSVLQRGKGRVNNYSAPIHLSARSGSSGSTG
jgi:hypothetical protein